jgi:hypothetical protein
VEELSLIRRQGFAFGSQPLTSAIESKLKRRISEADERVTPKTLAAFHALEQEGRPERMQLQESGDRCIEITGNVEWWFHKRKNPSRRVSGDGFAGLNLLLV